MRSLTTTERQVILRLLSADFAGRDELKIQVEGLRCRTIDSEGSLELLVGEDAPRSPVASRVPTEGHMQDSDGMMIHVLLHVMDGYMTELELYRDDSATPTLPLDAASLGLGYAVSEPRSVTDEPPATSAGGGSEQTT